MDPLKVIDTAANLADTIGGFFGGGGSDTAANDARFMNDFAWKQALRNEEEQKLLARNGIRMRVADAEAAGIHPLAAIGVNPAGGGQFGSGSVSPMEGRQNPMGPALSRMGQNLSRAAAVMSTRQEQEMHAANIELLRKNTDFVIQQIAESKARVVDMGHPKPQPVDTDMPFNPVKKMKYALQKVRDGVAGPEARQLYEKLPDATKAALKRLLRRR